jgi:hypothetical protein
MPVLPQPCTTSHTQFNMHSSVTFHTSLCLQESLNNLGVLEMKRDRKGEAKDLFVSAQVSEGGGGGGGCGGGGGDGDDYDGAASLHALLRNLRRTTTSQPTTWPCLQTRRGSSRCVPSTSLNAPHCCGFNRDVAAVQDAYQNVEKALVLYPQHTESLELLELIKKKLAR